MGFSKSTRLQILDNYGWECDRCSRRWEDGWMLECHHIEEKHNGGNDSASNGRLLCRRCHAKVHQEYAAIDRQNGDNKSANKNAWAARQIKKRGNRRWGH